MPRGGQPGARVRDGAPPFHIAHGADDTDVPPAQSEVLAEALRARGVDVEFHLVPGGRHFWRGATDEPPTRSSIAPSRSRLRVAS